MRLLYFQGIFRVKKMLVKNRQIEKFHKICHILKFNLEYFLLMNFFSKINFRTTLIWAENRGEYFGRGADNHRGQVFYFWAHWEKFL